MAKITRYDGNFKAFGSDATGTERTVFGSTTQTDDLTTNLGAEYQRGWGVLPSGQKPPKQYFNGALFGTSQAVAYLHQAGVAEWNGEQEYHAGSITNRNGQIFVCLTDDHVNASAPETDSTNWRLDDGSVATISALLNRTTVGTVNVLNYHTGLGGGGGVFYWDASKPKTEHNGGTVIAPNVVFPSDWNNQVQLSAWFDGSSLTGNGCWVRQYDGAVNVKWFGAKGDGDTLSYLTATDDTLPFQTIINKGFKNIVVTSGGFCLTQLDFGDFEGRFSLYNAELIAKATNTKDYFIKFGGYHSTFNNLKINGVFNLNYGCMFWWYNDLKSSQFNTFFGFEIRYSKRGIVYGELPALTSTGYAQSENSIYGLKYRGVERPLYMNHMNGLLFLSAPHLVSHDEEWSAFSSGNFDYTLSRAFESYAGVLVCDGGEIQNSIADTSSICATVQGGEVYLNGMATEVNVPFEISGVLVINGGRVLNTQSLTSQFLIAPSANSSTKLKVSNCKLYRNVGVGSFSSTHLVENTGASSGIEVHFDNCDILDWAKRVPLVAENNQKAFFDNVRWFPDGTQDHSVAVYRLDTGGQDLIDILGIDTSGNTTDGFYEHLWYGSGTSFGLSLDTPNGYYHSSLEIVATGQAGYFTSDKTTLESLKATAVRVKARDKFLIEGWFKIASGSQAKCALSLFDASGTQLTDPVLTVFDQNNGFMSTDWKYLRGVVEIPDGSQAKYAGFGASALTSTIRFCGLKVRKSNWNVL